MLHNSQGVVAYDDLQVYLKCRGIKKTVYAELCLLQPEKKSYQTWLSLVPQFIENPVVKKFTLKIMRTIQNYTIKLRIMFKCFA